MKHPVHSINAEGEQCTILNITGKFKESRLMTYDKGKKNEKLHNILPEQLTFYLELLNNNIRINA